MFFADTLSWADTAHTEPSNMFDNTTMIAGLGLIDQDLDNIKSETKNDDTLQEVIRLCTQGQPDCKDNTREDVKPYFTSRHDLTVAEDILIKGNCIVVPKK